MGAVVKSFTFDGTRGSMVLLLQAELGLQLQKYHFQKRFYEGALDFSCARFAAFFIKLSNFRSAQYTEILQQASISPSLRTSPEFSASSISIATDSILLPFSSPPIQVIRSAFHLGHTQSHRVDLSGSLPSRTFLTLADKLLSMTESTKIAPRMPAQDYMEVRFVLRLVVKFVD